MARLAALLPGTEVSTTDEAGISGDDMEALAFAWLAWRTLAGLPGNLPFRDRRVASFRAWRDFSRQSAAKSELTEITRAGFFVNWTALREGVMPSRTGKVEGKLMKKNSYSCCTFMLAGCSYTTSLSSG